MISNLLCEDKVAYFSCVYSQETASDPALIYCLPGCFGPELFVYKLNISANFAERK